MAIRFVKIGEARNGIGAGVASIAEAVAVAIGLVGVGEKCAVFASVAYAVTVQVRLAGVGYELAVIANVAHAVVVRVRLGSIHS